MYKYIIAVLTGGQSRVDRIHSVLCRQSDHCLHFRKTICFYNFLFTEIYTVFSCNNNNFFNFPAVLKQDRL